MVLIVIVTSLASSTLGHVPRRRSGAAVRDLRVCVAAHGDAGATAQHGCVQVQHARHYTEAVCFYEQFLLARGGHGLCIKTCFPDSGGNNPALFLTASILIIAQFIRIRLRCQRLRTRANKLRLAGT